MGASLQRCWGWGGRGPAGKASTSDRWALASKVVGTNRFAMLNWTKAHPELLLKHCQDGPFQLDFILYSTLVLVTLLEPRPFRFLPPVHFGLAQAVNQHQNPHLLPDSYFRLTTTHGPGIQPSVASTRSDLQTDQLKTTSRPGIIPTSLNLNTSHNYPASC